MSDNANGFERRKQQKIEQIFHASFQLFAKFGFQKVSVQEIAEQAKVSPATIYNYFGTKERLYAETLTYWMDEQLEGYESLLDSQLSFPEKTKEIMLLEVRNVKTLANEFSKAPSSELAPLTQMMESYGERKIVPFFKKYVALGKQEGYIRADRTEEEAMLYFTMYKNELARLWEPSNQERFAEYIDTFMELFFYGLVGQGPKQG